MICWRRSAARCRAVSRPVSFDFAPRPAARDLLRRAAARLPPMPWPRATRSRAMPSRAMPVRGLTPRRMSPFGEATRRSAPAKRCLAKCAGSASPAAATSAAAPSAGRRLELPRRRSGAARRDLAHRGGAAGAERIIGAGAERIVGAGAEPHHRCRPAAAAATDAGATAAADRRRHLRRRHLLMPWALDARGQAKRDRKRRCCDAESNFEHDELHYAPVKSPRFVRSTRKGGESFDPLRHRRAVAQNSICATIGVLLEVAGCLATQWRRHHREIVGYFNVRSSWSVAMQVLVVGAGVVGLGIARAVARAGHEVIVAEAESAIGTVTSARNSEVIHAGLYYTDQLDPRAPLPAQPPHALRVLRRARRAAPQDRQARGGVERQGAQAARRDLQAGADQRLRERRADRRRGGQEARAGGVLPRRDELAGDRHHRQPPLHARAARRDRGSRRHDRAQHAH